MKIDRKHSPILNRHEIKGKKRFQFSVLPQTFNYSLNSLKIGETL